MATEPMLASLETRVGQCSCLAQTAALSDFWALTKPEINLLIAITTLAGFCIGSPEAISHLHWLSLLNAVVGTVLVASGAATLNQVMERPFDALMRRTARRPVAAGRIELFHALWFGVALSVAGLAYLAVYTNKLASFLAAFTLFSYLFLYTPSKRRTPLCTLIGAVPGAMPPLIGWAAATGHLARTAWLLFAIVFLWQFSHFMSIAWLYREDYARAGYLVLPLDNSRERFAAWQSLLPTLALLSVVVLPTIGSPSGPFEVAVMLLPGSVYLYFCGRFALNKSAASARRLLAASILYLPAVFAALLLFRR